MKAISDLISHIGNKSNPHSVTKAQVGLGDVPNVATNDQTPTYTAATTLETLTSGEKLSVSFGKIMKAISDLISHIGNKNNPHNVTVEKIGAAAASHGTHVSYSTANPEMDGAATPGTSASVARSDHKHPTDTSRAPSIHASQHGSGGSDPITPAAIGAAASSHTHAAGDVASGTFAAARIPNLAASKITSGTFNAARIPTLDVSKISGAFPTGTQGAVNCDSLKDGCWTISYAATNGPKATACVIYHKTWDSNFATQLAICADRTVYSRIRSSGAWQPWTILINSVGGTIDGGLVVKSSAQIDGGLSVGTTLKVTGSLDAKTDQPLEIGKYIDFHSGASDSNDYITRIELEASTGDLIIRNSVASAKGGALLTTGKVIALYNVSVTLTSGAVKYSNSNIKQTSICFVQRRSGGVGNNTPFSVSSGNGYVSIIADSSVSGAMSVNILIINP